MHKCETKRAKVSKQKWERERECDIKCGIKPLNERQI